VKPFVSKINWGKLWSLHRGTALYGGFVQVLSENPTSFPAPKRLGLSWDVFLMIYSIYRFIASLRKKVNRILRVK